jgi:hypothetical protein
MNPVCVSTWHGNGTKYFSVFMETSSRNGIEPQNADDSNWGGTDWTNIPWHKKPEAYLRFVNENYDRYTHFLFVDSYDVLFAAGWDEIMEKFGRFPRPLVFGSECYPWPKTDQADLYPKVPHRCKYLNAGFWIATAEYAKIVLESLKANRKEGQCDQGALVDFYLANRHLADLDTACKLFFCCNMNSLDFLELKDGRPTCKDTGEKPCLFHGNGASPLHVVAGMLG